MGRHLTLKSILAFLFFTVAGCDGSEKLRGNSVGEIRSPNAQMVALVTRSSGNATVSFVDRVYLKSSADDRTYLILKADKSDGVSVKWVDDRHLQIFAPCAQIFSYTNFFYYMKEGKLLYPISIELGNRGLCEV